MFALFFLAGTTLAQNNAPQPVPSTDTSTATTSIGGSILNLPTKWKIAKMYTANDFYDQWDFYTDNDPTGGYVNYVSKEDAQGLGLVDTQGTQFIMRADAENRSAGRGRNSVRITSKDQFGDGVYILDINHMPTGCGTWPAFWTTVKDGWPNGGEIDIIEGANAYPSLNSTSYSTMSQVGLTNTTAGYPMVNDVASLHTGEECYLNPNAYMTGTVGNQACSAYVNGNTGCGAILGGRSTYGSNSFGSGVNEVGGGWFAMWRDLKNSGGVYVYYWPRNSPNVPDDVRNPGYTETDVSNWGQPGANLSIPSCHGAFKDHVIVFNIAFCGDYAGATYSLAGCPQQCTTFVQNYPTAFGDAYWSINSLRVYTANGKPAGSGFSRKAIIGIAVGCAVGVLALLALFIFLRRRRRTKTAKRHVPYTSGDLDGETTPTAPQSRKQSAAWVGTEDDTNYSASTLATATDGPMLYGIRRGSKSKTGPQLATKKARTGKTVLRPGMTAHHFLEGETPLASGSNSRKNSLDEYMMKEPQSRKGSWVG